MSATPQLPLTPKAVSPFVPQTAQASDFAVPQTPSPADFKRAMKKQEKQEGLIAFQGFQLAHHAVRSNQVIFRVAPRAEEAAPRVEYCPLQAAWDSPSEDVSSVSRDLFMKKLSEYLEGESVTIDKPTEGSDDTLGIRSREIRKLLLAYRQVHAPWLTGWYNLTRILPETMHISPEQLIAMAVFNEYAGFELSYPIYDRVDRSTNRTDQPPRVYIRLSTDLREETLISKSVGPRVGYLGIASEEAEKVAKYGLVATPKAPLIVSAALPRSPLDSTPYNIKAEVCVAINLGNFANSGGQAFLLPNGTVRLHNQVRPDHLYAVVCRLSGWDYITEKYGEQDAEPAPVTPPDFRVLILDVYRQYNPKFLTRAEDMLRGCELPLEDVYKRVCAKYGVPSDRGDQSPASSSGHSDSIPRKRIKLMPPSSPFSLHKLLTEVNGPVLRPREQVKAAAKSLPDPDFTSPADLVLQFIAQSDRAESARSSFEHLSPTQIMDIQTEERSKEVGINLLAGRATQRQVIEAALTARINLQAARVANKPEPGPEPSRVSGPPPSLTSGEVPSEGPERSLRSFPIRQDPLLTHGGTVLTRELAGSDAIHSGTTEKWMKYSMHSFPTSSGESRVQEMETEGWNVSSMQLSVFVANMGNLARPSVISGKKINRKTCDIIPLVARFVLQNWSHIRLFAESGTLLQDEFQEFLRGKNLIGAHGNQHETLSCYVTGNSRSGTKVKCIAEGGNNHMKYSIFEVVFGQERLAPGTETLELPYTQSRVSGQCTRIGRDRVKVCMFHTSNSSGYGAVGEVLKSMYNDVLVHRVDVIGGDGNSHAYYHSKGHQKKCKAQGYMELQNSLINLFARAFLTHYNEGLPYASRAEVFFFDNNTLASGISTEADLDCMVTQVISYGASPGSFAARQDIRARLKDIMKNAWYPDRNGPPGNLSESLLWTEKHSADFWRNIKEHEQYLDADDLGFLSKHSPLSPGLSAPKDYLIKISERVKHLERPDLWLGEKDTDWHIPILLTIREFAYRNWRKRSTEKEAARSKRAKGTSSSSWGTSSSSWGSSWTWR